MLRHRTLALLTVPLLAFLTACGSDGGGGDSGEGGSDSSPSGDATAAATDDGPLVRLTTVVYNGQTQYEFTYGPNGEPLGYKIFHPVTGELSNEFVIDEVDADGHVVEETGTRLPENVSTTSTLSYDADGRLVSVVRHADSGQEETTYTWVDGQVTMQSPSTENVYVLDGGNIMEEISTFSGRTTTTTYHSYDDSPNPFTLTGGMAIQVWSANNATSWSPPDGCTYTVELTYEAGLPVSSHAEGCASYVHDYTYEYAEF